MDSAEARIRREDVMMEKENARHIGKNGIETLCLLAIGTLAILYLLIGFSEAVHASGDGYSRWMESAYMWKGIYPRDIATGAVAPMIEIGKISYDTTTAPWTYFMSNLYFPGFFSWDVARVWFLLIFAISVLWIAKKVMKNFCGLVLKSKEKVMILAIIMAQFAWASGLDKLNNGIVVSANIILAMFVLDEEKNGINDALVGILMALAMMKPQSVLLFFIPLLIKKRFAPVLYSVLLVLGSFLVVTLFTGTNPIDIFLKNYSVGVELEEVSSFVYYGLFDFWISKNAQYTSILMIGQMAVFTVLNCLLCWRYRTNSFLLLFSIPAVISTMWSYYHVFDGACLAILAINLYLCFMKHSSQSNVSWKITTLVFVFLLTYLLPIKQAFYDGAWYLQVLLKVFHLWVLLFTLKWSRNIDPTATASDTPWPSSLPVSETPY